jgi:RNA recognition motif-containing protein
MNSQSAALIPNHHPKEIFCGNLSLFCEENDLLHLFTEYAKVRAVRIIRNQERTKSLMFGFVRFETVGEAEEMARLFNGQMFQGRRLK